MRNIWIAIILALVTFSCREMRPMAQDWAVSAPEKTIVGISCDLGWILEMPELRKLITNYPLFDQALELFLDKTQIDPSSETGRVSVYLLELPDEHTSGSFLDGLRDLALIQIAGFRDPKAIQKVIVESFPPEGSLKLGNRDYPLFVVMDINRIQMRILSDGDGRLWIGDLAALKELTKGHTIGDSGPISSALRWITPSGSMQGFVQTELVPMDAANGFFDIVPAGIKGLAWSISPSKMDGKIIDFDLVVTGTEEAITTLKPWMQRIIALVSSLGSGGTRQPETVQENNRMGIRCQFRQDQLSSALSTLNLQDIIRLPADAGFPTAEKIK